MVINTKNGNTLCLVIITRSGRVLGYKSIDIYKTPREEENKERKKYEEKAG